MSLPLKCLNLSISKETLQLKFLLLTMKAILNHHNQENINQQNIHKENKTAGHPSQETYAKPFRPTIKVGYKVANAKEQPTRRYMKPVIVIKNQIVERCGVRKVEANNYQALSGQFIESEYVPKHTEKSTNHHKKVLTDAHQKIYGGRQFSQELRRQFIPRSRSTYSITERSSLTERQKLASYRNEGIKDIIEYHHAGQYRPERVASKCNNQGVSSRCLQFNDLHEYDFRKSKPFP